jgi:hypothetical protein
VTILHRICVVGVVAGGVLFTAGSLHATSPEPPDPELAAEQAFASESASTFGTLSTPACWIDPSGAPITCFGFTDDLTVVVGIAQPNESFTFTEYLPAPAPLATEFGNGNYNVGTDIAPGVYTATLDGDPNCWIESFSDLTPGTADDAAGNESIDHVFADVPGTYFFEVTPDAAFVNSSDCGTWTLVPQ